MYASVSRNVSREEWMWRGLAIAMCLAMVGMAVMPMAVGDIGLIYLMSSNRLAGLNNIAKGVALDSAAVLAVGLSGVDDIDALALLGLCGIGAAAGVIIG